MTPTFTRAARGLAVLGTVVLAATACGSSGGGGGSSASGGSIAKSYHLAGAHFTVGGKEFTEQQVLANITADALQAAGATVKFQSLTGSDTVRTALTSGRIDMYWEYDGTAWLSYLNHTEPDDPKKQYQDVAQADLAQNQIKWLTPAKFSDAYGVAESGKASGPVAKVSTMSQMAAFVKAHPDQGTFCGASEFINRSDGLPGLEKRYDFDFGTSDIKTVDLSIDYTGVAKGDPCNFAEVFTTDGRIQTLNLKVLDDDKNVFGSYVPGLNVRNSVYTKYSKQLSGIAAALADKLDTTTMQELNKEVDVDGMTAPDVAKKWLSANGFTG